MTTEAGFKQASQALRNWCFLLMEAKNVQPSAYLSPVDSLFAPWLDLMRQTAECMGERAALSTDQSNSVRAELDRLHDLAQTQLTEAIDQLNPVATARLCLFVRGVELALEELSAATP